MNKSFLMVTILMFAVVVSCTQNLNSQPSYVYKKAPKEGLAAKAGDIEITHQEIMDGIEAQVFEAESEVFKIKFGKLKSILLERFMKSDSRFKDMTPDEYVDKYISSATKISEKDIEKFIKEQNIPSDHVTPQLKDKVKNYLEMEHKKTAVDKWLADKTKSTKVEVYIEKPRRPTANVEAGDAPFMGDKNAKVTIVEFSDFQCPYCARGADIMREIKKKYGNKVKIAFRNFPLPFHNQAEGAAVAGLCAQEQSNDLFWKLHDQMFNDQTKLDKESLKSSAKKLGLKLDQFEKCLEENKTIDKVKADMEHGKVVGVKSTPTFYVNGQLINGAQPIEVFSEIIDEELAK